MTPEGAVRLERSSHNGKADRSSIQDQPRGIIERTFV